jgi:hypothetical protein
MATEALTENRIDVEELVREAHVYLAAVDVFRGAGCEPAWQPESSERTAGGPPAEPGAFLRGRKRPLGGPSEGR